MRRRSALVLLLGRIAGGLLLT